MTIRERTEVLEREILSQHAALSAESHGRPRPEPHCPVRTIYQRDRDRIIHTCKAFRRLTHKTQVFLSPRQDHFRTRMTHTLEVGQIARTIAKALRLNEDLTEAIALGHDVGHTPFGHAGETALDAVYRRYVPNGHFHHAEQSARVVEVLEADGQGLNLAWEAVDGIRHHSKGKEDFGEVIEGDCPTTMEGKVVKVADRIAYVNHDVDDAVRAEVIGMDDLPSEALTVLGTTHSQRIGTMVASVIEHSAKAPVVRMDAEVTRAMNLLKDFLYERVYVAAVTAAEQHKVQRTMHGLFSHFMDLPEMQNESVEERARRVCDHVAGMTDRYAMSLYVQTHLPTAWEEKDLPQPFDKLRN